MPKNAVSLGKRYDNRLLNVRILLSRNDVVITQAPTNLSVTIGFLPSLGTLEGFGTADVCREQLAD